MGAHLLLQPPVHPRVPRVLWPDLGTKKRGATGTSSGPG